MNSCGSSSSSGRTLSNGSPRIAVYWYDRLTLVGDLWRLVEPDHQTLVEILQGVELATLQEIIPEQAEELFFFALPVRIPHRTGDGLESIVAGEIQETRMPDGLSVGPVAAEHGGCHVVGHQGQRSAEKVFESAGYSFQEGGLTLVAVEVYPELARGTQQAAEGVEDSGHSSDADIVG